MLKLYPTVLYKLAQMQPPSGGCVLKQECMRVLDDYGTQPPSGGCVLKPIALFWRGVGVVAATFGWLCVETS